MAGGIKFHFRDPADIPTPDEGFRLFADLNGVLSVKDSDGVVTPVAVGGGTTVISSGLNYWVESGTLQPPNNDIGVAAFTPSTTSLNNTVDGVARIAVAIVPKGTGGILAAVPDGSAVGGNVRGQYAVDLQLQRDEPVQVAAAPRSAIVGGFGNKIATNVDPALAHASSVILGGDYNEMSAVDADANGCAASGILAGWGNYISGGDACAIVGGDGGGIEDGYACFVGGGDGGWITGGGFNSVALGGTGAEIIGSGGSHAVISGESNTIEDCPENCAIVGGHLHSIYNVSNSAIVGGDFNFTMGGNSAIVGGYLHYIESLQGAIVGGYANNISAENGVAIGGQFNIVTGIGGAATGFDNQCSGQYSFNQGVRGSSRGYLGASVQGINVLTGGGLGSTPRGVMQAASYMAFGQTTNATPTVISATGAGGTGAAAQIILPNDSTFMFTATIVARRTNADNESAAYRLEGCIDRNTNAASTALVGTVTKTVIAEDTAAWDVAITADTTNGGLTITVTGEASKTIKWVAQIETVEVVG